MNDSLISFYSYHLVLSFYDEKEEKTIEGMTIFQMTTNSQNDKIKKREKKGGKP